VVAFQVMRIYFNKKFRKAFLKMNKSTQNQADEKLFLFQKDPYSEILNNHSLKGRYKGYRSINITGDIRAIYQLEKDDLAYFVEMDTHGNLYK